MRYGIGLMSGMSMDGIDVALVGIERRAGDYHFEVADFTVVPYPKSLRERIYALSHGALKPSQDAVTELAHLNLEIGYHMGLAAKAMVYSHPDKSIEWVGSHGQTVVYEPKMKVGPHHLSATLQIGEAAVIANMSGVQTVSDFRQNDIAAGGLGAPLAPIFHYHFFKSLQKPAVVINVGSISNVTLVAPSFNPKDVRAFDMGAGNMPIDAVMSILYKKNYDSNGEKAAKGKCIVPLYKKLMSLPMVKQKPPKALGFDFGKPAVEKWIKPYLKSHSKEDIVHTITKFVADAMAYNLQTFLNTTGCRDIVICGGGAHNHTMLQMLQTHFPEMTVAPFDDFGISAKAVEAVFCAFLGYLNVNGVASTIPHTTGAAQSVILGKLTHP